MVGKDNHPRMTVKPRNHPRTRWLWFKVGGRAIANSPRGCPTKFEIEVTWFILQHTLTRKHRFLYLGNHFNYGSKVLSITTKVVVQQAVFTPVFNTYFFGMQAILTGQPPSGIVARIRHAVPESMVNSLKLWPAVTAFSFAFILPQYRFMFSGIFAVCWQTYLSFLNRREEKSSTLVEEI